MHTLLMPQLGLNWVTPWSISKDTLLFPSNRFGIYLKEDTTFFRKIRRNVCVRVRPICITCNMSCSNRFCNL